MSHPAGKRRSGMAYGPGGYRARIEPLEPRTLLAAVPLIAEFMASNDQTLDDGDGHSSDWVELFNAGDEAINLQGWHLTDSINNLDKWTFPDVSLSAGGYLVVFASGQKNDNYVDPKGHLHTDFKLDSSGGYLALVNPDGHTVVSEFKPAYPPQVTDVSYGVAMRVTNAALIAPGAPAQVLVPTQGNLGRSWTSPEFVPGGEWLVETSPGTLARTGVGFDTQPKLPNIVAQWSLDEAAGVTQVADQSENGHRGTATGVTFGQPGAIPATSTAGRFTNGSIAVPFDTALNPSSFTITAWANASPTSTGIRTLISSRTTITAAPVNISGYFLQLSAANRWEFATGDNTTNDGQFDILTSPTTATLGSWTHLAITFEAATATKTLYVDGLAVASAIDQQYVPNAAKNFYIGAGGDAGTQSRFAGSIDDVSVWNTALSGAEIATLRSRGVPLASEVSYAGLIQTNTQSAMLSLNGSAYVRIPFEVSDPTPYNSLLLQMQYDDGFVAYLNGVEIARRNAPADPVWNSAATGTHPRLLGATPEELNVSDALKWLRTGTNVLAIQGLNAAADDGEFLILPQLIGRTTSVLPGGNGYFVSPTPRGPNSSLFDEVGPYISGVAHQPRAPLVTDPLVVTAKIQPLTSPIVEAVLHYRAMYAAELTTAMHDDGLSGDAAANDGIYTAIIPAGTAKAGQMLRYYITTSDASSKSTREPRIIDTTGDDRSPEYFGTVITDPAIVTQLPLFQWFTPNEGAADTRTGARASVFFQGEFYDNIFVRQRGGATNIGAQKFDFNQDVKKFFVNDQIGRVEEANLNSNGSDPAYVRQPLSFETFRTAGNVVEESFLMLMRVNGKADRVGVYVEQVDPDMLDHNGLDPKGALYKFVQRDTLDPVFNDVTTGIEKKTRLDEDFSDLKAVVDGLHLPTAEARRNFLFDNFDVSNLINYLAVRAIINDADDVRKNFYLYRDSQGDQRWSIIPWDKDWSYGVEGDGGPFLAHPFFGDFKHLKTNANQWSVLWDVVFNTPETRALYLRRLRTLMDELLKPAGTPSDQLAIEPRIAALYAQAAANLPASTAAAVNQITSFLNKRRNELFNAHSVDSLPNFGTVLVPEFVPGARYFVPANNDLALTWTQLGTFDDATWSEGQAGIGYQASGTDLEKYLKTKIPPLTGGATGLFVRIPFDVADPSAIAALTLRMKYDDGFVAYVNGKEIARKGVTTSAVPVGQPAPFNIFATTRANSQNNNYEDFVVDGALLASTGLVAGKNMLAIHAINANGGVNDLLALPQLVVGRPGNADAAGIPHAQTGTPPIHFAAIDHNPVSRNQDEEFIELVNPTNAAVDISGWKLAGGVDYVFPGGTVILPQGSLYVAANTLAFRHRSVGPRGGQGLLLSGPYQGHLSNFGETLQLLSRELAVVATVTTPADPSDAQQFLRVTEINYHPADPSASEIALGFANADDFEFVEVENISSNVTLDLAGVKFVGGLAFDFSASADRLLAPGQHAILVRNLPAFQARYGSGIRVAGVYLGKLDNRQDHLQLQDAQANSIQDFSYHDAWYPITDGAGRSLVVVDPRGALANWDTKQGWRPSADQGGSPGADEPALHPDPTVTNTLDDGPGSLREAISMVNAALGLPHTIQFAIPGAGPFVIQLASPLPSILDPVAIHVGEGQSVSIGTVNDFSFTGFSAISLVGRGTLVLRGVHSQTSPVTLAAVEGTLALESDAGSQVVLSAATPFGRLRLASSQHVAAIQALGGGSVSLAADNTHLVTRRLSIEMSAGSSLDLGRGALVIDYSAAANPQSELLGYLRSGAHGGGWDGSGLQSTAAQSDSLSLSALGMIDNRGRSAYDHLLGGTFQRGGDGELLPVDAVLIRWTGTGDANLDGKISQGDLNAFQQGLQHQGPPGDSTVVWEQGDFDYSGHIDGDDLTLLFVGYAANGGLPAPPHEAKLAGSEEPASVAPIAAAPRIAGPAEERRALPSRALPTTRRGSELAASTTAVLQAERQDSDSRSDAVAEADFAAWAQPGRSRTLRWAKTRSGRAGSSWL